MMIPFKNIMLSWRSKDEKDDATTVLMVHASLTRKSKIPYALLVAYRLIILFRLVALALFLHWRIMHKIPMHSGYVACL